MELPLESRSRSWQYLSTSSERLCLLSLGSRLLTLWQDSMKKTQNLLQCSSRFKSVAPPHPDPSWAVADLQCSNMPRPWWWHHIMSLSARIDGSLVELYWSIIDQKVCSRLGKPSTFSGTKVWSGLSAPVGKEWEERIVL